MSKSLLCRHLIIKMKLWKCRKTHPSQKQHHHVITCYVLPSVCCWSVVHHWGASTLLIFLIFFNHSYYLTPLDHFKYGKDLGKKLLSIIFVSTSRLPCSWTWLESLLSNVVEIWKMSCLKILPVTTLKSVGGRSSIGLLLCELLPMVVVVILWGHKFMT